jgi:hypothetical protein
MCALPLMASSNQQYFKYEIFHEALKKLMFIVTLWWRIFLEMQDKMKMKTTLFHSLSFAYK